MADRVTEGLQRGRQRPRTLARPPQRRVGIARRRGLDQRIELAQQGCIDGGGPFPTTPWPAAPSRRQRRLGLELEASFAGDEGVLFVGKAQEKASVFRTERRRNADGSANPWIHRSTTPVNHYYILDRDFGPLFIKFCSCFPYAVKVCLNGHEWLKRQLTQRGIVYEPLDNDIRATEGAGRVQRIANTFDAPRSTPSFAGGCAACRIPSPGPTERRAIAITSPSSKPNSP